MVQLTASTDRLPLESNDTDARICARLTASAKAHSGCQYRIANAGIVVS